MGVRARIPLLIGLHPLNVLKRVQYFRKATGLVQSHVISSDCLSVTLCIIFTLLRAPKIR